MLRIRLSLLILSFIWVTCLFCQPLSEKLDSVMATARDTHQVRALSDLAFGYFNARQKVPDTLFEHALMLASELNDDWGLARIYTDKFYFFYNSGEVEKGLLAVDNENRRVCGTRFIFG